MSWIATIALSEFVSRSWEGVCRSMPSSKLCTLESYRFRSWSHTLTQLSSALEDPGVDFKSIQKTLKGEQDILNSVRGCDYTTNIPLLRTISKLNTSLVQALPFEYKTQFKRHLVDQILQTSDINELGNMSTTLKEGPDHDVGTLIAMQRLIVLADQGNLTDHKGLVLDEAAVTIGADLGIQSLARLQGEYKDVIVEWLRYDGSWADKSVSSRLLKRLSTMASLLSDKATQRLTGTLQCQGYFHEPARNCFGLVYMIPTTDLTPRTLYQLIDEMVPEKKKPRFRPPLEYRFRLALDLCRSVQALHKINWLHRNIHSMNVICLSPPGVRDAEAAQDMRLMGLGASREDTHDSFTQGHDEEAQLRNYQHPSYLGGARYQVEFDCYSLGLVLLEIGLWSTLSRLGKGFKGMDDEAFRRNIIQKYVTQLEMTMGSNYMEAVRWCIECEPVSIPQQGSQSQSLEEMVMGRLHIL
ncbi:uncharacterized protein FMAN_14622 [Fusarium mangiferae]|uniref:Protein kinase domain-containing protein n=1 Tax=Fusarium mangiferae TaxID=192010 RepID=A0A1L7UND3_FUSMA|nr:uncharacterized protein FMAN_14622 [Fusarium mangiferae]CVL08806.1 uncharacterized protein FMAN_14622 [Fusarium mangiferae]